VESAPPGRLAVSARRVAAARRLAVAPAKISAPESARPLLLAQREAEWGRGARAHHCGVPAAAARGRQAAPRFAPAAASPGPGLALRDVAAHAGAVVPGD